MKPCAFHELQWPLSNLFAQRRKWQVMMSSHCRLMPAFPRFPPSSAQPGSLRRPAGCPSGSKPGAIPARPAYAGSIPAARTSHGSGLARHRHRLAARAAPQPGPAVESRRRRSRSAAGGPGAGCASVRSRRWPAQAREGRRARRGRGEGERGRGGGRGGAGWAVGGCRPAL